MINYKLLIKLIISVIDFYKFFVECFVNLYDGNCRNYIIMFIINIYISICLN